MDYVREAGILLRKALESDPDVKIMLTAPSLIGGFYFAGLAFLTSGIAIPYLPDQANTPEFGLINAAIGFLCGWFIAGTRGRDGWGVAFSGGLTSAAALFLGSLAVFSTMEMLEQSLRRHFDGPFEAIMGIFDNAYEYLLVVVQMEVVGLLVIGGLLGGVIVKITAKHWL